VDRRRMMLVMISGWEYGRFFAKILGSLTLQVMTTG
jgi:hypothetical protein